jgi:hypothetical protein
MESVKISRKVVDQVHREMAEQSGLTLRQFRLSLKRHVKEDWCHCKPAGDPIFHPDGFAPWKSCVEKHHYHCSICRGLTQIG